MRSALSLALVVALTMPPGVARAAGWSQTQRDTHDKIIGLENVGDLAGAVQLAVQEFADVTAPAGYRRAVARRGKAAALALFAKIKDDSDRLAYLCTAVALMRVYDAELLESEDDRRDVPLELARLEAQATAAAAPCTRPPAAPTPPVRIDLPLPTPPVASAVGEGRKVGADGVTRSRRLRAGAGLLTAGVVLFVPTAAVLAVRAQGERDLWAIHAASVGGMATDMQTEQAASLRHRYQVTTASAAALGATGAALAVTGVVLLATGGRRSKVAVAPWGARGVGGLVLEGKF